MKRKATAVVTVVSSKYTNMVLTPEQRQTSLNEMITLALESIIK
jgi:purine-nucleoside phosphorylase